MGAINTILSLRKKAEESILSVYALLAKADKATANILQGEHAKKKEGSGEKFWQYKEYQIGDRPQDIDWRQSAKGDKVYTKQKEWQVSQKVMFWCNQSSSMNYKSSSALYSKQETAQIITLALALLFQKSGELVGVLGLDSVGRSQKAIEDIATFLCLDQDKKAKTPKPSSLEDAKNNNAENQPIDGFQNSFTIPKNCFLVLIGDFLDPIENIEKQMQSLRASTEHCTFIQILDPSEKELPYSGRVIFENPCASSQEHVMHVGSIKKQYKEKIENHLRAIEALCQKHSFSYMLHISDTPITQTIEDFWQQNEASS